MDGNFRHDLGEIAGQLKSLIPALERLEVRQREAEGAAIRVQIQYDALRKEFDEYRSKTASRVAELFRKYEGSTNDQNGRMITLVNENTKLFAEQANIKAEIAAIKARSEGLAKKAWDIFQLIASAGLGGLATWFLSRGK